jgi:drug/metabolite transporter (DMT)-like permease
MVAATLLWGATFVASRDILHVIAPVELVCARFTVASAVLALLLLVRRAVRGPVGAGVAAALAGGAVSGVLGAGGYLFQAIGLTRTSAGSSAFLTCVGTVLAAMFAWPILGQRPSATLLQGMALALAGSALLSSRAGLTIGVGEAWTLAGAVVYALQIVAVARWAPRADVLLLTGVQTGVLALTLLPFAGRAPTQLAALDAASLWRFAYLALAGSVIAPLLQVGAQRTLSAGRIALLFALEPVFGLVFAITLGAERFALGWWIGALLILGGVVRVEWPARQRDCGVTRSGGTMLP